MAMIVILLLILSLILTIVALGFFVTYTGEAATRMWRSKPQAIDSVIKAAMALFAAAICAGVTYDIIRGLGSMN